MPGSVERADAGPGLAPVQSSIEQSSRVLRTWAKTWPRAAMQIAQYPVGQPDRIWPYAACGKVDPARGPLTLMHPWIINIQGKDIIAPTPEAALALAEEAESRKVSYDVGIMQINSYWIRKYKIPLPMLFRPKDNVYMTTPRSQIGIEALLNFSQGQTASDPVPLTESAPQEGVSEEPDLTDFDMMEQIRDSLDQDGSSPLLNIEGALKFDEDPVVDLKEDFIEIGLAAGLSADDAETTAVESENAINEALSVAYAPPLPDPGTDVEAELSALVESMELF